MSWTINLRLKIKFRDKNFKLKSIIETKLILFENTQIYQNQFYIFKIIFASGKSKSKHALNLSSSQFFNLWVSKALSLPLCMQISQTA